MMDAEKIIKTHDKLGRMLFGMTLEEAHEKDVCIRCKKSITIVNVPTKYDKAEYEMSGFCVFCYDEVYTVKR